MLTFKNISLTAVVLTAALVGGLSLPAQAHETGEEHTHPTTQAEERRQAAEEKKAAALAAAEERKTEHQATKQEACEAHKQGLTNKFSRIVTASERAKARIDAILTKAQDFKQTSGLTVANYDELLAAAEEDQTAVATAITDLKAVTPSLDCNNVSVKTDVQTFKTAATTTRDSLKDYKKSVKALVKALRDAKQDAKQTTETTETTEGGQQ